MMWLVNGYASCHSCVQLVHHHPRIAFVLSIYLFFTSFSLLSPLPPHPSWCRVLPSQYGKSRVDPLVYLTFQLAAEDEHSAVWYLKKRGWIAAATMETAVTVRAFSMFTLVVTLTEEGEKNLAGIAAVINRKCLRVIPLLI